MHDNQTRFLCMIIKRKEVQAVPTICIIVIIFRLYKDCYKQPTTAPYLCHKANGSIHGLQFCPYEDVLGVGHERGFSSLLIPGL